MNTASSISVLRLTSQLALLALGAGMLWALAAVPVSAEGEARISSRPTITSSPQNGAAYAAGEMISVSVSFSEAVTVSGSPRLRLEVGEKRRWARYLGVDGSGTTLSFAYVVKAVDQDADGVSFKKNSLDPDGGTITDADGNRARLRHGSVSDQAGHQVGGAPDEPEPEPTPTPTPEPPANNEPQFADDTADRSVIENTAAGENVGAAVTADDGDGDALTYALVGADAGSFNLDAASGQLTVKDALNYEDKASYTVTVTVHDGKNAVGETDTAVDDTITVAIEVGNIDEPGVISFNPDTPSVGTLLAAVLTDPDGGVRDIYYTWQVSADANSWHYIPCAGAAAAAYTPSEADLGKYLRVTASYADAYGWSNDKYVRATTADPVQAAPPEPALDITAIGRALS